MIAVECDANRIEAIKQARYALRNALEGGKKCLTISLCFGDHSTSIKDITAILTDIYGMASTLLFSPDAPHPLFDFSVILSDANRILPARYNDTVAVGGTFDHLHIGHKLLLSVGALQARSRVVVGVSGDLLLRGKAHSTRIQPFATRCAAVKAFIKLFYGDSAAGVAVETVEIEDVYGPTATDASIDALVVSTETLSGARKINDKRLENQLPPLQILPVSLVLLDPLSSGGNKVSSSLIRFLLPKDQE